MQFNFEAIGVVHSGFKEKFGIPRQPGLVPAARAAIELLPPYDRPEALRGLEGFSHLWLLFVFHASLGRDWKPTVRPPRLGGNARVGVFASRSNFRPNPIGMSVVEFAGVREEEGRLFIDVRGADLLDATPLLDIKPYVAYADALPEARSGFADGPPPRRPVRFGAAARDACAAAEAAGCAGFTALVESLLAHDPRPAYREQEPAERVFGMRLYDYDVKWREEAAGPLVLAVERVRED